MSSEIGLSQNKKTQNEHKQMGCELASPSLREVMDPRGSQVGMMNDGCFLGANFSEVLEPPTGHSHARMGGRDGPIMPKRGPCTTHTRNCESQPDKHRVNIRQHPCKSASHECGPGPVLCRLCCSSSTGNCAQVCVPEMLEACCWRCHLPWSSLHLA